MIARADRARAAAGGLTLLLLGACSTNTHCTAAPNGAIAASMDSGGAISFGARFTIAEDGGLYYENARARCTTIDAARLEPVLARLRSTEAREYLRRVEAMGYRSGYSDSPHIALTVDGATTFIPIALTLDEPLRSYLQPLDDLLSRTLGRAYTHRLMPRPEDRDALRELMPKRLPQP